MNIDEIRDKLLNSNCYNPKRFNEYGVVLPLVKVDDEVCILFEKRVDSISQPNEICFPGGKVEDSDDSVLSCAIRETVEELNIKKSQLSFIKSMNYHISSTNKIVHPFVFFIEDLKMDNLRYNRDEVAEIFVIPVDYFINTIPKKRYFTIHSKPHNVEKDLINESYFMGIEKKIPVYFYIIDNRIIWGLTADILVSFSNELK